MGSQNKGFNFDLVPAPTNINAALDFNHKFSGYAYGKVPIILLKHRPKDGIIPIPSNMYVGCFLLDVLGSVYKRCFYSCLLE